MSKPEKKIKVKITRQTMAGGEVARVDDVITLPENEARYLIGIGKAVEAAVGAREVRNEKTVKPAPKKDDKKAAE